MLPRRSLRPQRPTSRLAAPITQALLSVSDKTGSGRFRARACRARHQAAVHRRHRESARRRRTRRSPRSPPTPASRKCSTDASRRCTRKCTAASWRAATCRRTSRRLASHDIPTIDLVVVNLYPFRETVAKPGCTLEDAIENIDIGGPAMVRSAAKNHAHVGVVVDPADYPALLAELRAHGATLRSATRFALAQKAFSHTAAYDGAISNYLTAREPARRRAARFRRVQLARHEAAGHALRRKSASAGRVLPRRRAGAGNDRDRPPAAGQGAFLQQHCRQRRGVGMRRRRFAEPACVIVKHANPCGVALAPSAARRVPEGVRDRPDVRLRRHHRLQSRGRRRRRRRSERAVPRSAHRARRTAPTRSPPSRKKPTCACSASRRQRRRRQRVGRQARRRRHAGADRRCRRRRRDVAQGRHSPRADAGAGCRPAVRRGASPSSSNPTPSSIAAGVARWASARVR